MQALRVSRRALWAAQHCCPRPRDAELCASLARLLHTSGIPQLPSSGTGVKPLGATVSQTRSALR